MPENIFGWQAREANMIERVWVNLKEQMAKQVCAALPERYVIVPQPMILAGAGLVRVSQRIAVSMCEHYPGCVSNPGFEHTCRAETLCCLRSISPRQTLDTGPTAATGSAVNDELKGSEDLEKLKVMSALTSTRHGNLFGCSGTSGSG